MPDPITYQSVTPRRGLPLLFAAQAQKEVVLNEALSILDALTHPAVEEERNAPPANPQDGQCWLVGPAAAGDWAGHAEEIACLSGGDWLFLAPSDGLRCWVASSGQWIRYEGGWIAPEKPAIPAGGQFVDAESRASLEAVINALTEAGIFPR